MVIQCRQMSAPKKDMSAVIWSNISLESDKHIAGVGSTCLFGSQS